MLVLTLGVAKWFKKVVKHVWYHESFFAILYKPSGGFSFDYTLFRNMIHLRNPSSIRIEFFFSVLNQERLSAPIQVRRGSNFHPRILTRPALYSQIKVRTYDVEQVLLDCRWRCWWRLRSYRLWQGWANRGVLGRL